MKYVIIMFLCSNIVGNDCKLFEPEYTEFNSYHECTYHAYDYSSTLLRSMGNENVDEYQMYTIFSCKEVAET